MKKQRICKDCGTEEVILKVLPKHYTVYDLTMELCSACLHSRAQLQQIKEDKLSFPKLIAKIQGETNKRVHSEIESVSGLERLRWMNYKGVSGWNTVHSDLSNYWKEQLS